MKLIKTKWEDKVCNFDCNYGKADRDKNFKKTVLITVFEAINNGQDEEGDVLVEVQVIYKVASTGRIRLNVGQNILGIKDVKVYLIHGIGIEDGKIHGETYNVRNFENLIKERIWRIGVKVVNLRLQNKIFVERIIVRIDT